ncbi:MAG: hypothetical protein IT561_07210 [Alphaproteobacteria bacterium]|nr:hypothetical protein [Alphaproteobacteria bacterium]
MLRPRFIACLAAAALAGCAGQSWTKPGVEPDQMHADYRECVRLAQPAVDRDARIESDIMSTRGDDYRRSGTMLTRRETADARVQGRQDDIVDACMRSRGYSPAGSVADAK